MQTRAVRLAILALLVVTTLGAAYFIWDIHGGIRAGLAAEREVDARLDRLSAAAAALGGSQQAYVAPGQQRGDALTRASLLVQQIYDDIPRLRVEAKSTGAGPVVLAFGQSMDALVNVDDRIRDHLRLEQELMAADLVYTEARQAIEAMTSQLKGLRDAERLSADAEREALFGRAGSILAGLALLWCAGLLALLPVRPRRALETATEARRLPVETSEPPPSTVDIEAAAKVCGELSRLSSAGSLPTALAHAARVLDASGLVIWLGAGEELFPATGHGYGPRTLARLGPIPRGAENATAMAWRTGEIAIVPGSPGVNGAIVAPLMVHSGCFGVLAAELRHGRENDQTTRAVATIIAAQLSAAIAPWPAPSEVEEPAPSEVEAPVTTESKTSAAQASA